MEVWSEYVKVTAPLAVWVDKLQALEKAYMKYLLPQLRLFKVRPQMLKVTWLKKCYNFFSYLLHNY